MVFRRRRIYYTKSH